LAHPTAIAATYDRAMNPPLTARHPAVVALAAGMICLGILGLANGDFALVWQPVPAWVPLREALAYGVAAVSLAAGLGLTWPRRAAAAAGVALGYFFLWWLLLRVPAFVLAPLAAAGGLGENTVALAGALALYAALHPGPGPIDFLRGRRGILLARIALGVGLIGCGEAHFYGLKATAEFVPPWIPGRHLAWAVATGSGYLAAAAAILLGLWPRLAATLVTAMMAAFTALVWLVDALRGPRDRFHLTALTVSWTLTAAAWIVTGTYRGSGWLARPNAGAAALA
jgi:uncharacterized membrane protein YphA (DoxX/SURF4 family)